MSHIALLSVAAIVILAFSATILDLLVTHWRVVWFVVLLASFGAFLARHLVK
jgi:hypothetical protein